MVAFLDRTMRPVQRTVPMMVPSRRMLDWASKLPSILVPAAMLHTSRALVFKLFVVPLVGSLFPNMIAYWLSCSSAPNHLKLWEGGCRAWYPCRSQLIAPLRLKIPKIEKSPHILEKPVLGLCFCQRSGAQTREGNNIVYLKAFITIDHSHAPMAHLPRRCLIIASKQQQFSV